MIGPQGSLGTSVARGLARPEGLLWASYASSEIARHGIAGVNRSEDLARLYAARFCSSNKHRTVCYILLSNSVAEHGPRRDAMDGHAKIFKENNMARDGLLTG